MVYYIYLGKYVSEDVLMGAGFNLEGSYSAYFNFEDKEAVLYHGCFQNWFSKKSEFDFVNMVVVGVRRENLNKIDYYFGIYHRRDHEIGDSEEIDELMRKGKETVKKKNRIALRDLEKRIKKELRLLKK